MPKSEKTSIKGGEKLGKEILNIVVDNFDYFREHPSHLAWAMRNYGLAETVLQNRGLLLGDTKDLNRAASRLKKRDSTLLYDAFGVAGLEFIGQFFERGLNLPLDSKPNKTLDEWVQLLTDKRLGYQLLYPDECSVWANLLLNIGTGYEWSSDGFIFYQRVYPHEFEEEDKVFAGYTRVESQVRKDLREKILELKNQIASPAGCSFRRTNKIPKKVDAGYIYEPISKKYSNLATMPDNAHVTYAKAGWEIAKEILGYSKKQINAEVKYENEFIEESRRCATQILERWDSDGRKK